MFHESQTELFDRLASTVRGLTECMLQQEGDHQLCLLCDGKRYEHTGKNQICSFLKGDQLIAGPPDTPIRGRYAALLSTSREFPKKSHPLSCEPRVLQGGQGLSSKAASPNPKLQAQEMVYGLLCKYNRQSKALEAEPTLKLAFFLCMIWCVVHVAMSVYIYICTCVLV